MAVLGGGHQLPQWGPVWGSSLEKFRTFGCKFLLSGALSARKLTPVKVQNTTHFHSRLDYVHPVRGNSQDCDGMRDTGARKRDVPAKTGRVATLKPRFHVKINKIKIF